MSEHKKFLNAAVEIGNLVEDKNAAYGDSFQKSQEIIKILYPNGIRTDQYRDVLGIIRVLDKMFRLATNKQAFEESPWTDICGYGLLGSVYDQEDKDK